MAPAAGSASGVVGDEPVHGGQDPGPLVAVGQQVRAMAMLDDQQPLVGDPGPLVHGPSRAHERLIVGRGHEQHRPRRCRAVRPVPILAGSRRTPRSRGPAPGTSAGRDVAPMGATYRGRRRAHGRAPGRCGRGPARPRPASRPRRFGTGAASPTRPRAGMACPAGQWSGRQGLPPTSRGPARASGLARPGGRRRRRAAPR
jgi:hypothetical protein